ncbi:MAG: YceI family protein [bacterium]|nr:YceI family protein [bacterium]
MNALLLTTLLVLGLASILLLWKKEKRLMGIFNTLFTVTLIQWAATHFNSDGAMALHVLTGVLVVGYLIAQFVPKKAVIGAVSSTILVLAAFFFAGKGEMVFNEGSTVAETKFVVAGILMGALVPFLIRLKLDFLSKWIPALTPGSWSVAVYPLLAGIGFLIASLGSPIYGPLLVGTAFLINSFFDNKRSASTGVSVVALASIPLLLIGEEVNPSLLSADVVGGLLIGAFSLVLLNKLWSGKRSALLVVIAYGIIFATVFGITSAGGTYEQLGGFDAFVAMIIGAGLVNAIKGKTYQGVSLLAPLFAFGLVVPSLLVNEEEESEKKEIITIQTDGKDENGEEVKGPEVLPLNELSGKYNIQAEESVVQFELGKEGSRTKGQFKKVSGTFNITEDLTKASVNVVLDMKDFTTFNSMRDKSLRGEDYFHTDRYPKMTFKGTGFVEKGDGLYEVEGSFTMLGKSKPVTVKIQRIKLEDRIVLIGSGSLDRTEFGMTPNANEGNVVDFNYQAELQK